jgi:hypothetical protein
MLDLLEDLLYPTAIIPLGSNKCPRNIADKTRRWQRILSVLPLNGQSGRGDIALDVVVYGMKCLYIIEELPVMEHYCNCPKYLDM